MRTFNNAYFGLAQCGPVWVPSVVFTRDRDRECFLEIAKWLEDSFGLELAEEYGESSEDGKEYWTFKASTSKWM